MMKSRGECNLLDIEEYMDRLMKKYEDILVNINALEESQSLKVIGFRISGSTVIQFLVTLVSIAVTAVELSNQS